MEFVSAGIFVGEYRHNVDAKGRLTIPSQWRIQGDENGEVYLALPNPAGFVTVYPPEMIGRLKEKVSEMSMADLAGEDALSQVMSMAHSFSCDKNGRINLNEKLLKHAGITKEAVLLGKITSFSIYSPEQYESAFSGDLESKMEALRRLGF